MSQCQYCKKTFSSGYVLDKHQKTAKFCIKIQQQIMVCEYCDQMLSNPADHKYKCTVRNKFLEEENEKLKIEIEKLNEKIFTLASRPTTNVTNTRIDQMVNNLLPVTNEHMQNCAQFLTIDHIKEGGIGYANYAINHPFKDRLLCTDYARRKIKYKGEDGEVFVDPNMNRLAQKLFQSIDAALSNLEK